MISIVEVAPLERQSPSALFIAVAEGKCRGMCCVRAGHCS